MAVSGGGVVDGREEEGWVCEGDIFFLFVVFFFCGKDGKSLISTLHFSRKRIFSKKRKK